jgi:hypothetical protein
MIAAAEPIPSAILTGQAPTFFDAAEFAAFRERMFAGEEPTREEAFRLSKKQFTTLLNAPGRGGLVALPLPLEPEAPFAAATPVFRTSSREESETYVGVVAALNPGLRVIRGSCGLQWIVQKRKNPERWTSFAFCATKEGLLLRLSEGGYPCDVAAWAIIDGLPAYFPKGRA